MVKLIRLTKLGVIWLDLSNVGGVLVEITMLGLFGLEL